MLPLIFATWLAGCTEPEPTFVDVPHPHFAEWESLVRTVAKGDLASAKIMARDLTGGPPAQFAAGQDHNATVGAALGFLQMAEDSEEMIEALSKATEGCAGCHAAAKITRLGVPGRTQADVVLWAASGAVWGLDEPWPLKTKTPEALHKAWSGPAGSARLTRVLVGAKPAPSPN